MNKQGNFTFKAITGSVSGAAVIGGVFLIALGAVLNKPYLTPIGVGFVIMGVLAAFLMTLLIKYG